MYVIEYRPTEVRRQPADWTIRDVGTLPQARALRATGCRVGAHVLSRPCAQCGAWGDVLVSDPDEVTEAVEFITRDGWRCNTCRHADTAHLVPSPKPTRASRSGSGGATGPGRSRKPTQRQSVSRKQRAIATAWKLYQDACDALDDIAAGRIPISATDSATKQRNKAWRTLARYGVVRSGGAWGHPTEVQA